MKTNSNLTKNFILFRIIAVTFSIIIIFIIIEFSLRIIPIPGIEMSTGIYDPEINLYKYAPNSTFIRTNIRNERIVRSINSEGFLDQNNSIVKPNGVYRIGFFGDSYVEACQVSLEKTFFRLIEDMLSEHKVETLAFGDSGHGTIHSYLKSRKYTDYFDLDMVIYVFFENDLGDQMEVLKKSHSLPYVELKDNIVVINDSLLSNHIEKSRFIDKIKKYSFYNNSILLQTINNRLKLLWKYGIKFSTNESDFTMSGKGNINKSPTPHDLPSTWNSKFKKQAIVLGEAVISKWFKEVKLSGREFAISYVPRQTEWKKNDIEQDSWKYWLKTYCKNNRINFIDPTIYFLESDSKGKYIYDDHFSEYGHVVFAESFIDWYIKTK